MKFPENAKIKFSGKKIENSENYEDIVNDIIRILKEADKKITITENGITWE